MLAKTRGIVLHSVPYKDNYSIIYMYTEAFGRVSYLVSRGRSKKAVAVKSLYIPLSVLDLEVEHSVRRDLHKIKEARLCFPLTEILCNPIKNVLALFLSEVLFRVVRNMEPDKRLFTYLKDSILLLEKTEEGLANFHLVFLFNLSHYLGIYPNTERNREGVYFDLLESVFVMQPPQHRFFLSPEETRVFSRLLKISYENMSFYSFSRQERMQIIYRIFEYYRLHLPAFPEIKSFSVLQMLFDS